MNYLKIAFVAIVMIVLGLVIGLPFTFDLSLLTDSSLTYYIISKVLFGVILIISAIFALLHKHPSGTSTVIFVLGLLYQLIPLGLRYLLLTGFGGAKTWAIIIMAFALIVYIGLILGLSYQDKKGAKAEETFKSKEIPVEEEKTIL